jgi:hypothetical protein
MSGSSNSAYAEPSPSDIGRFRVFISSTEGTFIPISHESQFADAFWVIASAASVALDLLQSEAGVAALRATTLAIKRDRVVPAYVQSMSDEDIQPTIYRFLNLIRKDFPHILLTRLYGMHDKNGRTNKNDCFGEFSPKKAALIEINATVCLRFLLETRRVRIVLTLPCRL